MDDDTEKHLNNDTSQPDHGQRDLALRGDGAPGDLARRNAEERRARAAATLRENLLRRKQQGRARRAGAADETSGLPAVKTNESDD